MTMNIPEVKLQKVMRLMGCCAPCVIYYLKIKTGVKILQLKKYAIYRKEGEHGNCS
jgi:hypothetical protein